MTPITALLPLHTSFLLSRQKLSHYLSIYASFLLENKPSISYLRTLYGETLLEPICVPISEPDKNHALNAASPGWPGFIPRKGVLFDLCNSACRWNDILGYESRSGCLERRPSQASPYENGIVQDKSVRTESRELGDSTLF